ncbi:MAG: anti-sigma F factor antagonist, partial [Clostridia bacterium]|nr:anti-sigma F factor antagonist [Clostridia bacterium]
MFLQCSLKGSNLVARPVGELDLQVADLFRQQLERHLAITR